MAKVISVALSQCTQNLFDITLQKEKLSTSLKIVSKEFFQIQLQKNSIEERINVSHKENPNHNSKLLNYPTFKAQKKVHKPFCAFYFFSEI